jgi:hypothetical protein
MLALITTIRVKANVANYGGSGPYAFFAFIKANVANYSGGSPSTFFAFALLAFTFSSF